MKYVTIVLALATIINTSSCVWRASKQPTRQKDSLVFKTLDTVKIDSLNQLIIGLNGNLESHSIDKLGGKGKTWKLWKSLHKDCQNDDVARDKIYFGVSNTLGIGTIVEISEDGKVMPDFKLQREKLNDEQVKLVYSDGSSATCQFDQTTKVGAEFMAQSQFSTSSSADLNSAMSNTKEITAKMDSWQKNTLLKGGLSTILENTNDSYLQSYKKRLSGANRFVIAEEFQVNGFSATIITKTAISADLKVKLQGGLIQNVGDTAAQVKFTYVNDTTIKMTTVGKFVVFCTLIEAKYVN